MRKRKNKNNFFKDIIGYGIVFILLFMVFFGPNLMDQYHYNNAQKVFNKKAEQYDKKYTVSVYDIKGGDTVHSISHSLYEEYGKSYGLSEKDIYYGIRSLQGWEYKCEASCIYSGDKLIVPYIR